MKMRITALSVLLLAVWSSVSAAVPGVRLEQKLDSAYLLMGKVTRLNIELVTPDKPDGQLMIDAAHFPAEVELTPQTSDTVRMDDGRYALRQELLLQSFDSGMYTLPPVLYLTRQGDTVRSRALALKVNPVDVDSLQDIHDYEDVADADSRWYDSLPDWMVDYGLFILLALVAAGIFIYLYLRYGPKRIKAALTPKPKPKRPAWEVAREDLRKLREKHLWENGREREYYTRLTEILRVYLQERFGINAMEMTSRQIIEALEKSDEARPSRRRMEQILRMADFVKFAKAQPLSDDNERSMEDAVNFVEETLPKMPENPDEETPGQTPKTPAKP